MSGDDPRYPHDIHESWNLSQIERAIHATRKERDNVLDEHDEAAKASTKAKRAWELHRSSTLLKIRSRIIAAKKTGKPAEPSSEDYREAEVMTAKVEGSDDKVGADLLYAWEGWDVVAKSKDKKWRSLDRDLSVLQTLAANIRSHS